LKQFSKSRFYKPFRPGSGVDTILVDTFVLTKNQIRNLKKDISKGIVGKNKIVFLEDK